MIDQVIELTAESGTYRFAETQVFAQGEVIENRSRPAVVVSRKDVVHRTVDRIQARERCCVGYALRQRQASNAV
jgi:hypothetical protein